MTEETEQERPTLEGEAVLDLWRRGQDAWNSWIDRHPDRDISFYKFDFSNEQDAEGDLSFAGYHFGNGAIFFDYSTFGNGYVEFHGATFGNGTVRFIESFFGDGDLRFTQATFGSGVSFLYTTFGNGNVDFSNTTFGIGEVDFSCTTFGKGNVDFSDATFGNGNVDFSCTTFGEGNVDFSDTTFGNGNINFSKTTFGDGNVDFSDTVFGDVEINFSQSRIENLNFNPKTIGASEIDAKGLSIKGRAIFDLPPSATALKSFNLHSASFDGPLTLTGDLGIIPDLRATRYSHQVDLSALTVKLQRRWQKPGLRPDQWRVKAVSETGIISRLVYKFAPKKRISLKYFNKLRRFWKHHCWPIKLSQVAKDPQDSARLRRLKEIAETNKDHQAALRFSADENRAKRWIETAWLGSVLDMAFSFFSNYGQSILRPSLSLGVIFAAGMSAYKAKQIPKLVTDGWADWTQAFILSASNSLPFLPQSRDLRTDALTALYGKDPGLCVDALMITQGVLSFIFLFLIGLGLRNRFRL
ncbi:hypothetical protein AUP42_00720 [Thalassospira lucentensis]|uniref:Pentapeptide repeat-containing protein n=1 Tax=Thalassospira lucentensis TaxID=168935 RepID=A0A154L5B3_9PROT|nr:MULTISPECIES: pentapeptide repeat-containing protein [Thalassospira]KZB64467.1 hypothetical protein AUP42_00720 [Thalassospira lucentensis]MCH2274646.1 pentapeptide repeat-containing protein [Thalassospira sp.]